VPGIVLIGCVVDIASVLRRIEDVGISVTRLDVVTPDISVVIVLWVSFFVIIEVSSMTSRMAVVGTVIFGVVVCSAVIN